LVTMIISTCAIYREGVIARNTMTTIIPRAVKNATRRHCLTKKSRTCNQGRDPEFRSPSIANEENCPATFIHISSTKPASNGLCRLRLWLTLVFVEPFVPDRKSSLNCTLAVKLYQLHCISSSAIVFNSVKPLKNRGFCMILHGGAF